MRVQKWISQLGIASRRSAEKMIEDGRVSIDQKVAKLGDQIDPDTHNLSIDGQTVKDKRPPMVYWLFNKPDKVIVSNYDKEDRTTIFQLDRLKDLPFKINFIGRLDYRTEGLLLLSNDGELCHRLCHPKYKVSRHYQVLSNVKLTQVQIKSINRSGVKLEDGNARCEIQFAQGTNLGKSKGYWYYVTVFEGRNRLVRRIFESLDAEVLRLIRYGFGNLRLPYELKAGEYKQLSSKEVSYLKKMAKLKEK